MKILCTADWQCRLSNLDVCRKMLDQILRILSKEKCDYLIHLGDAKDDWTLIDQRVTNFLIEAAQEIQKYSKMIVLTGNHDLIAPRDGVPNCLPVFASTGAEVVDMPRRISLSSTVDGYFAPYRRDNAVLRTILQNFAKMGQSKKATRLLFFHAEIEDCQRSVWSKGRGISLADLVADQYELCIGGHMHHQHQVGPNTWYVGSPFCIDWGEVNQDKGYLVVETSSKYFRSPEQVPSEIPGWYDPNAPRFPQREDWKDQHIRITVPILPTAADSSVTLAEDRKKAEKSYPGAVLHIVPEYQKGTKPTEVQGRTDETWISDYLKKIDLGGFSAEQISATLQRYLPKGGMLGIPEIRFQKVSAGSVLCFKEAELDLNRKGITLVTGVNHDWGGKSNGSGKSSLLALPWIALFGQTPKGQKFDAWALYNSKATASVNLDLMLPDGKPCSILRCRHPSQLLLCVDKKDQTFGDSDRTQEYLESLTGFTWNILTNAIYIGQDEIGSVFGTDKQRKELFSRLLGLDRFLDVQKALQKLLLKRKQYVTALEQEITVCDAIIDSAKHHVAELEESLSKIPEVDEEIHRQLLNDKQTQEALLLQYKQQMERSDTLLNENQKVYEGFLDRAARFETIANDADAKIKETAKVQTRCPTCGQKVASEKLATYVVELKEISKRANKQYLDTLQEQSQNRTSRSGLLDRWREQQDNLHSSEEVVRNLDLRLADFDRLKGERQRVEELLEAPREQVRESIRRQQLHERAKAAGLSECRFVELCISVIGRDGLPAYLCSLAAPQLNAAAMRYAEAFSSGEISVRFEISQGEIDVQVDNKHGGRQVKDQSKGEMRIVGLIAAFAFRDVLVPYNLLILDEPGEGLDAENARVFARGLESVVSRFGTVFVVTHNQNILNELKPDYHLRVEKRNGISTVMEVEM